MSIVSNQINENFSTKNCRSQNSSQCFQVTRKHIMKQHIYMAKFYADAKC